MYNNNIFLEHNDNIMACIVQYVLLNNYIFSTY